MYNFYNTFWSLKVPVPIHFGINWRKRTSNSNFRIVFQWRKKVLWVRKLWFFLHFWGNYYFNTLPDWPLRDMESLQSSYEKTAIMMVSFMRVLWMMVSFMRVLWMMVSFMRVLCLVKVMKHSWGDIECPWSSPHCFYLDASYFMRHIL